MAHQFAYLTLPANLIALLNLQHAALWSAGPVHYDLAEVDPLGVEQVPSTFYATPITTISAACNCSNRMKALYNDHLTRSNGGSGAKVYSHKVVDSSNTVSTADMADGSTYDAAMLASIKTLVDELRLDYAAHTANTGGVWHTAVDTVDILGGAPAINDWADLAEALNNLKAQYEGHRSQGASLSIHVVADSTNTLTAPNAVSTDPDSCLVLANQLKARLNAHRTQAGVHALDDSINVVSAADAAYPANLFGLANALKSAYNTHRASTTWHDVADGTNAISGANATTVATLLTLVEELRQDLTAHFRAGPASAAARSL